MTVPGQKIFLATGQDSRQSSVVRLYDSRVSVNLSALGGAGGKGGDGGNGGDGAAGNRGMNATKRGSGTSGTNGGNGGRGGHGANGGNAGNSANINLYVKFEDIDILPVLRVTNKSIKGGNAGLGGRGGSGGMGGIGGSSFTWTETETISITDSHGKSQHVTRSETRTNPGGSNGASGSPGQGGNPGIPGLQGADGSFKMNVVANSGGLVTACRNVFQLVLEGVHEFTSSTGIIEPGQEVLGWGFKIANKSDMMSPARHVHLLLRPDSKLQQICGCKLDMSVAPLEVTTTADDRKVRFAVKVPDTPPQGQVVSIDTDVYFQANLVRINRLHQGFCDNSYPIHSEYPVALSDVHGGLLLLPNTEIPMTWKVRNHSLVAVGSSAPNAQVFCEV